MKKLITYLIIFLFLVMPTASFATDWFACASTANINAAEQWSSTPSGSCACTAGAYLTWASLGATDNLYANGCTAIAINVNFTAGKISTADGDGAGAGVAGGGFITVASTPITVAADIDVGTTSVLVPVANTGIISWTGDISYSGTTATTYGVTLSTPGNTYNLTGSSTGGGNSNCHSIFSSSTSTCSVSGTVTGGSYSGAFGLYITSAGNCTVHNCVGGGGTASNGCYSASSGVITVTGNRIDTASASGAAGRITYQPEDGTHYISAYDGVGDNTIYYGADTDPGAENVKTGTSYVYHGVTTNGSLAGGGSAYAY